MRPTHICINCMKEIPEGTKKCQYCGYEQDSYVPVTSSLPPYTILIGRYQLGRVLGSGGFGITYLAMDLVLSRKVCVKEFFLRNSMYRESTSSTVVSTMTGSEASRYLFQEIKEKFLLEAKIIAGLNALPGIVQVYDFFNENNTSYIVMEYLDGFTLKDYVKRQPGGRLDWQTALDKLHPVINSLSILHNKGILHRDISPDNIMVLNDGGLKLFDFGGARIEDNSGKQSRVAFLKPGYSPVEQYHSGRQGQGTWSDVYAMAATLYYCISGKAPIEATRRVGVDKDPIESFKSLQISVPKQVEEAIFKGLAINRKDRYQKIEEFERDLYTKHHSKPLPKPELKPRRSYLIGIIAALVCCAALLLFVKQKGLLNRNIDKKANGSKTEISSQQEKQAIIESETSTQKSTEKVTETVTEKPTEKVTQAVTEKQKEKVTETVTDKPTEEVAVTEKVNETVTEKPAEKETEPQTEAVYPLDGEKYVGTYRAGENGVMIWLDSGEYNDIQSELRHVDSSAPYQISPDSLFIVDEAAAFRTEVWLHTDYYGVKGWIRQDGSIEKVSGNNLSIQRGEDILLNGSGGSITVRSDVREDSSVIAELPSGTVVNLVDYDKGQGMILFDNQNIGWINMDHVNPMISGGIYRVNDNAKEAILLTDTGSEAYQLVQVPGGTSLLISTVQDGYGITAYSGFTGWIALKDLTFIGDQTEKDISNLEKPGEVISSPVWDWHNNLLMEEHGTIGELKDKGSCSPEAVPTVFGVQSWIRDQIKAVYVLDTLENQPQNAVDISAAHDGSVMGWLDQNQALYIAGNGGVMAPENCDALFAHMENAQVIDLGGNLHTDQATTMRFFFYRCRSLQTVNLEGLVTDNVIKFTKMFTGCHNLRALDLSGFNTQSAKTFLLMFQNCYSLTELDLTSFRPVNATDFTWMFRDCTSLRKIIFDPQNFRTVCAEDMMGMFLGCSSLESVDVSMFDTSHVTSMNYMFSGCTSLRYLDTTYWNVSNVKEHVDMFADAYLMDAYGRDGELWLFG